jgi:hypothetical protein
VSIQSSVQHSKWVARRLAPEHRVKAVDHMVRATKDEPALGVILQPLRRFGSPLGGHLRIKPAHREPALAPVLFATFDGPA